MPDIARPYLFANAETSAAPLRPSVCSYKAIQMTEMQRRSKAAKGLLQIAYFDKDKASDMWPMQACSD